jgi:Fe-S-cluster-containing dehydrogenase component
MNSSRREILKKFAGGVIGGFAALAFAKDASAQRQVLIPTPEEATKKYKKYAKVDPLIRMQAELKESIKRPNRKWVMVIDLRKCVGCHACTVACIAENKLPQGVVYRPVADEEIGRYPNVRRVFLPRPCLQCDNPPCVSVCPVTATWKAEDGIVDIDYMKCVGCRYCIVACPYDARVFDTGKPGYLKGFPESAGLIVGQETLDKYEEIPSIEYNKKWARKGLESPINNVRKCHFCRHRLVVGMLPACVVTCIGRATYFGDRNNPNSLVSELIAKPNVMVLKAHLGTKPNVFYLI